MTKKSVRCLMDMAECDIVSREIRTFSIPPDFCLSGLKIPNNGFPTRKLSRIGIWPIWKETDQHAIESSRQQNHSAHKSNVIEDLVNSIDHGTYIAPTRQKAHVLGKAERTQAVKGVILKLSRYVKRLARSGGILQLREK